MSLVDQIMAVAIVLLGLVVGVAALLGPFGEIIVSISKYVQKLFAGPVKTEPFATKPKTKSRKS